MIEGVLSGTLSFSLNSYTPGSKFSDVVRKAKELGYTEPDPRDDYSGVDVARKALILDRAMDPNDSRELSDIKIDSLVPEPLRDPNISVQDFMARLSEYDAEFNERIKAAEARGEVLRYVASIQAGGEISVGLKAYPKTHPFASLRGADNMFVITTKRYPQEQPLVIRGPGAGAERTASGVMADLLRVAREHTKK